ncbi:MAG: ribonuclease III [Butyrivibrio sp.]|nr:ribonuclease III [Butyrivibrio sp.]
MGERVDMYEAMEKAFALKEANVSEYSPLTLAYIGDGVYELIIRTSLVHAGNAPVDMLNRRASRLAKAGTQAAMADALLSAGILNAEEEAAYRRGRNAHSPTRAKNATVADYRRATGFEALIGWLYMQKSFGRIMEIVSAGWAAVKEGTR